MRDRVAVALVDRRVDDLVVRRRTAVEQRPSRRGTSASASAPRAKHAVSRPGRARARRRHAPAQSSARRAAGDQRDERDEGEEPRDVEVEPVRQHELEADEQRRGERGELERRLAPRARRRAASAPTTSSTCEHALDEVQVGDARARGTAASPRARTASRGRPGSRPCGRRRRAPRAAGSARGGGSRTTASVATAKPSDERPRARRAALRIGRARAAPRAATRTSSSRRAPRTRRARPASMTSQKPQIEEARA